MTCLRFPWCCDLDHCTCWWATAASLAESTCNLRARAASAWAGGAGSPGALTGLLDRRLLLWKERSEGFIRSQKRTLDPFVVGGAAGQQPFLGSLCLRNYRLQDQSRAPGFQGIGDWPWPCGRSASGAPGSDAKPGIPAAVLKGHHLSPRGVLGSFVRSRLWFGLVRNGPSQICVGCTLSPLSGREAPGGRFCGGRGSTGRAGKP